MSIDDGVIKFSFSNFNKTKRLGDVEFIELESVRHKLHTLELIGEYKDLKIGYGNLSMKADYSTLKSVNHPQFVISGSQTGNLSTLTGLSYTRVVDYDLDLNKIEAVGPIMASSESLTHAAIYECNSLINAVLHIHNKNIWDGMLNDNSPKTKADVPYGTLEMARAVKEVVANKSKGILAMAGHEDGVIIFGKTLDEALALCLELNQEYNNL